MTKRKAPEKEDQVEKTPAVDLENDDKDSTPKADEVLEQDAAADGEDLDAPVEGGRLVGTKDNLDVSGAGDEGLDKDNDPEKVVDASGSGIANAEDGVHNVVESKETPRSDTAPVTALRRNLDDFVESYSGQRYQCLATEVATGRQIVVGYTDAADGGGMIELVDASTDKKGPLIVKLTDEDRTHLNNEAYAAKAAANNKAPE